MDSKMLRRALLMVTLFVAMVFVIIILINDNNKKSNTTANDSSIEEVDIADENGMILGSDLKAWMNDETFFDAKVIGDGRYDNENGKPLVVSTSSIEKDLRIKLLDENGNLIKGKLFSISLSEDIKASDDDMDGVIHIMDLKPGDYKLLVDELAGFIVPTDPILCNVKARVSYKAIDDISYLIKTEAEVDSKTEDTAINDAAEESSGNSAIKTVDGAKFGIDVSKYNGLIDWKKAKESGVEFAIIRCGYRGSSSGVLVVDPFYEINMNGAIEAGIPVGVYFFTQATNNVEAVEEASAVINLIGQYELTYPIFVDTESAGGKGRADNLEVIQRSQVVQTFCETIRNGGYTAGVYASRNWFNKKLDVTKLSADNVTWLAEYDDKPSYGGTYQLWQYSSAGKVNGIEGNVDMNISYLSVEE